MLIKSWNSGFGSVVTEPVVVMVTFPEPSSLKAVTLALRASSSCGCRCRCRCRCWCCTWCIVSREGREVWAVQGESWGQCRQISMSREEESGQAWLRDWLSLVEASRKTTEPPLWKTFKVYSCTDVQVYSGTVLLGRLVR